MEVVATLKNLGEIQVGRFIVLNPENNVPGLVVAVSVVCIGHGLFLAVELKMSFYECRKEGRVHVAVFPEQAFERAGGDSVV